MTFRVFLVVYRHCHLDVLEMYLKRSSTARTIFGIMVNVGLSDSLRQRIRLLDVEKIADCGLLNSKSPTIIKKLYTRFDEELLIKAYEFLFEYYDEINVNLGLTLDFYRELTTTLKSARLAMKIYERGNYHFKLVGVAQGQSLKDYMDSIRELINLGYDIIAIGGLLKKLSRNNNIFLRVSDEVLMVELLDITSQTFDKRIILLGVFNEKRIPMFKKYNNIYGCDFKGWVFRYDKRKGYWRDQVLDYLFKLEKMLMQ